MWWAVAHKYCVLKIIKSFYHSGGGDRQLAVSSNSEDENEAISSERISHDVEICGVVGRPNIR
jgi:hypothetical protein